MKTGFECHIENVMRVVFTCRENFNNNNNNLNAK